MPIWRLIPVDLADLSWEASSHKGPALVRAGSEEEARSVAQKAFGVKTRFGPGAGVIGPPWKQETLVQVQIASDTFYEADGPSKVLEPSFDRDIEPEPRK